MEGKTLSYTVLQIKRGNGDNFAIIIHICDNYPLFRKFAPLIGLSDEDMDMDTMITTYNTAVTDAASEILGKERRRKKPWVTKDVLDLCDERRNLKKKRYEAEGAKEYREANRRVQKAVKKAKEDWIGAQCEEIETCLDIKQQQESISAGEGSNFRETG